MSTTTRRALDIVAAARGAVAAARRDADAARAARDTAEREAAIAADAAAMLLAVADASRSAIRRRIERVVGLALAIAFGQGVHFQLEVAQRRGQIEMTPLVGYTVGKSIVWRSLADVGGGVVDVVAFALRLSVVAMSRRTVAPIIIADEPFRHVSSDRMGYVAQMVRRLADELKVQIIVVSHEPELAASASTRIFVTRTNNVSRVTVQ